MSVLVRPKSGQNGQATTSARSSANCQGLADNLPRGLFVPKPTRGVLLLLLTPAGLHRVVCWCPPDPLLSSAIVTLLVTHRWPASPCPASPRPAKHRLAASKGASLPWVRRPLRPEANCWRGLPGLRAVRPRGGIVHLCPLASAAGGGDRYSVGYSVLVGSTGALRTRSIRRRPAPASSGPSPSRRLATGFRPSRYQHRPGRDHASESPRFRIRASIGACGRDPSILWPSMVMVADVTTLGRPEVGRSLPKLRTKRPGRLGAERPQIDFAIRNRINNEPGAVLIIWALPPWYGSSPRAWPAAPSILLAGFGLYQLNRVFDLVEDQINDPAAYARTSAARNMLRSVAISALLASLGLSIVLMNYAATALLAIVLLPGVLYSVPFLKREPGEPHQQLKQVTRP